MKCAYCNKEIVSGYVYTDLNLETMETEKKCCEDCFQKYIVTVKGTEVFDIPSGKTLTVTRITK